MKIIVKILIILVFLVSLQLHAETVSEYDTEKLFAEKKAIIKETLHLTEKESAIFWPIYNDYEKIQIKSFNKRTAHFKGYLQKRNNLSDKQARKLINEYLKLDEEALKYKRKYFKKYNEKLPAKKVYQLFQLEEVMEAGFFSEIAKELPLLDN